MMTIDPNPSRGALPMSTSPATTVATVSGMTCGHCVAAVREEVSGIDGVSDVDVVLETGSVTITSDAPLAEDAVRTAVEEAGYELVALEQVA
jgi:copper chaperone